MQIDVLYELASPHPEGASLLLLVSFSIELFVPLTADVHEELFHVL